MSSIVYHLVEKGESMDHLETIYSISFMNKKNINFPFSLFLKSTYIDNHGILCEKIVDDSKVIVHISNIKKVVNTKGIENLNNFETIVYILNHGLDDDIMKLNNEVVQIMEQKGSLFSKGVWEDLDRIYAESQRILYEEELEIRKKEGIEEGIKEGQDLTSLLYKKLFMDGNLDDMNRCFDDSAYREELLKKYGFIH